MAHKDEEANQINRALKALMKSAMEEEKARDAALGTRMGFGDKAARK
jgi:hypothetical protein